MQSFNDFIVFGLMTIGSFSSGGLLSAYGWDIRQSEWSSAPFIR